MLTDREGVVDEDIVEPDDTSKVLKLMTTTTLIMKAIRFFQYPNFIDYISVSA
jgi:hypothetical protein